MELNLTNLIEDKIIKNFNHKFLLDKKDVSVKFEGTKIIVCDLFDTTDPDGTAWDEEDRNKEINGRSWTEYKMEEQEKKEEFLKCFNAFIRNILTDNGIKKMLIERGLDWKKYTPAFKISPLTIGPKFD